MEKEFKQKQENINRLEAEFSKLINSNFDSIGLFGSTGGDESLTNEEISEIFFEIYQEPSNSENMKDSKETERLNWLINRLGFISLDRSSNVKNGIIFDKEKKEIILKRDIDNSNYNKKDDIIVNYKDFFTNEIFYDMMNNLINKKSPSNNSQEDMNYLTIIATIIKFFRGIDGSNNQITIENLIAYFNRKKATDIILDFSKNIELVKAFILAGDIEIVRYFIRNGIDITTIPNVDKLVFASNNPELIHYYEDELSNRPEHKVATYNALGGACMSNNANIVEYLFNNYDNNQINNKNSLIKVFSVIKDPGVAYKVLDRLGELGYNIKEIDFYNEKTILEYAIENNHFEVIQFLLMRLKEEKNEFLVDTEENIFKCSIEYDCPEILDFLLKTCDKSLKGNFSEKFKNLLVSSLTNYQNVKIVEILFNHFTFEENELFEAFPKLLRCRNLKKAELLLEEFFKKNYDVNKKDGSSKTLLHYAIENSNVELVKKLLNNNKLNLESDLLNKSSLLKVAIEVENIEIIKLLINKMKNKEGLIKEYKNELLLIAVKNNDFNMVKTLLSQEDIDVNVKSCDEKGYFETPLYLAVSNNNLDMVKLLLTREDIDVNLKSCNEGEYSETPLHLAVRKNNLDIVKLLLTREDIDVNVKSCDEKGYFETPLHLAVRKNNLDMVKLLLTREDIDVNVKSCDEKGYSKTPLYLAISNNNLDMVKLLLARKDIKINLEFKFYYNSKECYETLFHLAVRNNNSDMVKLLLTREDIDINAKSILYEFNRNYKNNLYKVGGETPLLLAVKEKKIEVVKVLLATIKNNDIKEEDKKELLSFVIENNDLDMVKLLLAREDIDVNTIIEYSDIYSSYKETLRETLLYKFVKDNNLDMIKFLFTRKDIDVNIKCGFEKETPLHLAAKMGNYEITEALLLKMRNIDLTKEDRNELLFIIIEKFSSTNFSVAVVKLLLEREDINIYTKSKNGKTTLRLAVEERNTEIVRILLSKIKDIKLIKKDKNKLLLIAVKNNNLDIVKLLLTREDINIYTKSKNGKTTLRLAVEKSNTEIVKILLSRMKDIELTEEDKKELFPIAVKNNNLDMVKLLLTREDINIYTKSKNGKTTLRLAVEKSNTEIVKILLSRMKDIELTEEDKKELFPIAVKNNNLDMVKLLLIREDIDVDTKSKGGKTPLYVAIENDNLDIVKLLLFSREKIDINTEVENENKKKETSLRLAVKEGKTKIVRILLYRMKDMELTEEDKNELLFIAVKNNNLDIVKLLLTREDININAEFKIEEKSRKRVFLGRGKRSNFTKNKDQTTKTTALGIAVKNKNKEIVKLLISFILEKKIKIDKNLKDEVCNLLGREIEIEINEDKEKIKEQSEEKQKVSKKKSSRLRKKPKKPVIDSDDNDEEDLDIGNAAKNLAKSITNNNILSNGEKISNSLSDSENKEIELNK